MKLAKYRALTMAVPLTLAAMACGQVTGLSNDYQYDLEGGGGGGSTTDGPSDAPAADGPVADAALDVLDATAACTAQAINSAQARMNGTNGTAACKTCLATACCGDVETCFKASECKSAFSCKLECTTQGDQRAQCLGRCTNVALYSTGIGACGGRSCKTECGFP